MQIYPSGWEARGKTSSANAWNKKIAPDRDDYGSSGAVGRACKLLAEFHADLSPTVTGISRGRFCFGLLWCCPEKRHRGGWGPQRGATAVFNCQGMHRETGLTARGALVFVLLSSKIPRWFQWSLFFGRTCLRVAGVSVPVGLSCLSYVLKNGLIC
jgi:hypothetical protein